jgi:Reverse transcriptase (RNA-dependent DNA polymerase).
MRIHKQYPIESSPLYRLSKKRKIAELLRVSLSELYSLYPDRRYNDFKQPKKDGTLRNVSAPDERLKAIQKRLLSLLQRIETPEWLLSGKKKKSYIDNARFHAEANEVVTIDIRKFYDNCSHKYIYAAYQNIFKTSPDVAHLLAKITTRAWGLPTGAPTSQLIAYWAYSETFAEINEIANKYGCLFSLYVDDMTFSSLGTIPLERLLDEVSDALRTVGHRIKYSKIEHYRNGKAKLITGAVVDREHVLRVPNGLRYKIVVDMEKLKSGKLTDVEKVSITNTLMGRLMAARNIEPGIFPEILKLSKASAISHSRVAQD